MVYGTITVCAMLSGYEGAPALSMVLWALPSASAERAHGMKYRLFCGRPGECLVRYDNEPGKGDHRHYGNREES